MPNALIDPSDHLVSLLAHFALAAPSDPGEQTAVEHLPLNDRLTALVQQLYAELREREIHAEQHGTDQQSTTRPIMTGSARLDPFAQAQLFGPNFLYYQLLAYLLGPLLELIAEPNPDEPTWQAVADIAFTAQQTSLSPRASVIAQVLLLQLLDRQPDLVGNLLTADLLTHTAGLILARATQAQLTLPPELLPGGLYALPHQHQSLSEADQLLARRAPWCTEPLCPEERTSYDTGVLLALEWLEGRARYMNAPILALLQRTAVLLTVAEDVRREAKMDTAPCRGWRERLQQVRRSLGQPRVPALQRPVVVRREDRKQELAFFQTLLSQFTNRLAVQRPAVFSLNEETFQAAEQEWSEDLPDEERRVIDLRLRLTLYAALCFTRHAPGMGLSDFLKRASARCQADPDWHWATFQEYSQIAVQLAPILEAIEMTLSFRGAHAQTRVQALLGKLAAHLLACCRTLQITLPFRAELEHFCFAGQSPNRYPACPLEPLGFQDLIEQTIALNDELLALEAHAPRPLPVLLVPETEVDASPSATLAEPGQHPELQYPQQVLDVRALLAGRAITLLGGIPRPAHLAKLKSAFQCPVNWVDFRQYEHGSHAGSEIRPDTGLVILAVRWMAHAHNGLREIARERGIPWVMHPGGLSPAGLAFQIQTQAGERLHASRDQN